MTYAAVDRRVKSKWIAALAGLCMVLIGCYIYQWAKGHAGFLGLAVEIVIIAPVGLWIFWRGVPHPDVLYYALTNRRVIVRFWSHTEKADGCCLR